MPTCEQPAQRELRAKTWPHTMERCQRRVAGGGEPHGGEREQAAGRGPRGGKSWARAAAGRRRAWAGGRWKTEGARRRRPRAGRDGRAGELDVREVLAAEAAWSGGADKEAEQGQGCTQAGRGGDAIETRAPGWVECRETESAGGGEQGRPSLRQGRQRRCPGICLCPDRRLPVVFINAASHRLFRWNAEIGLTVPQQQCSPRQRADSI